MLKYSYTHDGLTTVEPSYDFGKNAWDFAVSRRIYGNDVVRASYRSSTKVLGLDWTRTSSLNGSFKVCYFYLHKFLSLFNCRWHAFMC